MASDLEFVNYKDFVKNLAGTESLTSSDKVVVSNPTNGPRSMPGSAKDRSMAITAFRTGDVIPVDGPNGPAKMSASDLQNAILNGPIDEAVQAWLDEHPEATTTVQDGSLTKEKFSDILKLQTIKDYVTPEMFGAKGDGVTDDTSAFVAAAATGKVIIGIASRYAIGGRFTATNSVFNLSLVALATDAGFAVANTNNVSIENVDIDYNGQVGTQCIEAQNVKNLSIRNLKLYGAGSNTGSMIFGFRLREKCDNVLFENCEFSDFNGAVGGEIGFIVISNNGNAADINKHIKIIGCTFSEIGPSDDADAVKVISGLNDDRDCFLLVSGCTFKNCRKRAMKFQGNECISSNNVIVVNKPMYTAIDFQRSRCSSFNDRIVLDYDGVTQVDYYGLLNHGFSICGDDCVIRGLKIECRNTIAYTEGQYSASRVFDFGSLNGKTEINNTSITDCEIGGFGCVLYADNILEKINNLLIDNLVNITPDPDTEYYRTMVVGNVKFDRLTIRGKFFGKYQAFLTTNTNNDFTNCFIDIYGYIDHRYFTSANSIVRIRTSIPENNCWVRGFDFERGALTLYMRGTSILDNVSYSSHNMAIGTPVGTRVKFKNGELSGTDVYNEAICYEAGTSTTTGKYKNILVSTT